MFLDNDRVSVKRLLGKFLVIDRMVQEILGFKLTIKLLRSLLFKKSNNLPPILNKCLTIDQSLKQANRKYGEAKLCFDP